MATDKVYSEGVRGPSWENVCYYLRYVERTYGIWARVEIEPEPFGETLGHLRVSVLALPNAGSRFRDAVALRQTMFPRGDTRSMPATLYKLLIELDDMLAVVAGHSEAGAQEELGL